MLDVHQGEGSPKLGDIGPKSGGGEGDYVGEDLTRLGELVLEVSQRDRV